jgi:hypothetical protein
VTPLPNGVSEISWNTKLKSLLPSDFIIQDEWIQEKTSIRDALSMMSGMPTQVQLLSSQIHKY